MGRSEQEGGSNKLNYKTVFIKLLASLFFLMTAALNSHLILISLPTDFEEVYSIVTVILIFFGVVGIFYSKIYFPIFSFCSPFNFMQWFSVVSIYHIYSLYI